jgi:Uma2 family endonuclease
MTWLDLCNDKKLQDLPCKIELNRAGRISLSLTRNRDGYFASQIALLLDNLMDGGKTLVECAIETNDSTKVADVVWVSEERFATIINEASCSIAPEICVEVISPSNSDGEITTKQQLYLWAGAKEFWACDERGRLEFFDATGRRPRSGLCPAFPKELPI